MGFLMELLESLLNPTRAKRPMKERPDGPAQEKPPAATVGCAPETASHKPVDPDGGDPYEPAMARALCSIFGTADGLAHTPASHDGTAGLPQSALFSFDKGDYSDLRFLIETSTEYSLKMLEEILDRLMTRHGIAHEMVLEADELSDMFAFLVSEGGKRVLYIVRKFGLNSRVRSERRVERELGTAHFDEIVHLSLVEDGAYAEQIDHNNDSEDPSRGTRCFPLRYFFDGHFGPAEYPEFKAHADRFTSKVMDRLNYSTVKELSLAALNSFKGSFASTLRSYPYKELLRRRVDDGTAADGWLDAAEDQFLGGELYLAAIGTEDFATSLVTAEWLYGSLGKMRGVDLSPIAMGYTKAVEQLLYRLVYLRREDSGRRIYTGNQKTADGKTDLKEAIRHHSKRISLKSLIGFLEENPDLLRDEVGAAPLGPLLAILDEMNERRGAYFHRANLVNLGEGTPWDIVEKTRGLAFLSFYLVLGSYRFDTKDRLNLGVPGQGAKREFTRLWEHIRHSGPAVFFVDGKGPLVAHVDPETGFDPYGRPTEVRLLFGPLGSRQHTLMLDFEHIPHEVSEGRIIIRGKSSVSVSGPERTLFVDGKYTGPL